MHPDNHIFILVLIKKIFKKREVVKNKEGFGRWIFIEIFKTDKLIFVLVTVVFYFFKSLYNAAAPNIPLFSNTETSILKFSIDF